MTTDNHRNKIITGDAENMLKTLPAGIVHTCVTSPPYFGLRDYLPGKMKPAGCTPDLIFEKTGLISRSGIYAQSDISEDHRKFFVPAEIGREKSPAEYIEALVSVFREVKRVLTDDGTLWVVIGDSYTKSGKPKNLTGIPWMLALSLQEDGWFLRQDIIWAKTNPLPQNVKDRCTSSHEYIFLLSKSKNYYFDSEAIAEDAASVRKENRKGYGRLHAREKGATVVYGKRNKRDVWECPVAHYEGGHYATFPSQLITPCVLAGAPKGGLVLDPFMGSGTTALVAKDYGRDYLGVEINEMYKQIAEERIGEQDAQIRMDVCA